MGSYVLLLESVLYKALVLCIALALVLALDEAYNLRSWLHEEELAF